MEKGESANGESCGKGIFHFSLGKAQLNIYSMYAITYSSASIMLFATMTVAPLRGIRLAGRDDNSSTSRYQVGPHNLHFYLSEEYKHAAR